MKPFMRLFTFIFFAGLLGGGCLLEGVKLFPSSKQMKEQREKAFDLSGIWLSRAAKKEPEKKTEKKKPQVRFELSIENQSEEKKYYDICMTLERKSPLTQEEKELLSKAGLRDREVLREFKNFDLGCSSQDSLWFAGDNRSEDEGKSSQFFVQSDDKILNKDETGGLYYTLEGRVEKAKMGKMTGQLTLHTLFTEEESGGRPKKQEGSFSISYELFRQKEDKKTK